MGHVSLVGLHLYLIEHAEGQRIEMDFVESPSPAGVPIPTALLIGPDDEL